MTTIRVKTDLGRKTKRERANVPAPPTRLARMLALAYLVEERLDGGAHANYAEAARDLGITRARLCQILDLRLLPIEKQEAILLGMDTRTERAVRKSRRY